MRWSNVLLILQREVRDQLRDRRTLFMIFVLPLLLYPLLGMSFSQIAQFVREHAVRVLVLGSEGLPESPPLIVEQQFAAQWFGRPEDARLLELELAPGTTDAGQVIDEVGVAQVARERLDAGKYDVVVHFPPDFAERLQAFRGDLRGGAQVEPQAELPAPEIFHNTAKEKSQIGFIRVSEVLRQWREAIARESLAMNDVDTRAVQPFSLKPIDVAEASQRDAVVWSKIFPVLLLIWALTGAFYPAIDLCAGEKERGTLETLLSSPARRSEIVWGKLLTIMLFSAATVVLNVSSIAVTGTLLLSQLPNIGAPPALSLVWLLVTLPPVSAMFSALCLAVAAFARSSKEGQYYLMPLVLVTLPLVILPMAPGVELTLGNALIPLTGVVLLLRAMIEGNYWQALPYVIPVTAVTAVCCLAAIRWAVDQFNSESVLFRESERLDLGLRLKRMLTARHETPSAGQALACVVLILMLKFFLGFALPVPTSFAGFARMAVVTQLLVVLAPVVLLTLLLTRSPRRTLLWKLPTFGQLATAALLAVVLHPAAHELKTLVMELYPVSEGLVRELSRLLAQPGSPWVLLGVAALLPAICEELAFRGYVLSGLRHLGHRWRAIVLSSIAFGLTHAVFQQSLVASVLGCLLGYLAVQSGSLWPGVLFHALHNALALSSSWLTAEHLERWPVGKLIFSKVGEEGPQFHWAATLVLSAVGVALLWRVARWPHSDSPEEALQQRIEQHRGARALLGTQG